MKAFNFAIFIALLALVGCDENAMDDDIPETVPGQYDPDINNDIDNPNGDLDPDGSLGVDDEMDDPAVIDRNSAGEPADVPASDYNPPVVDAPEGDDTDVVEEVPPGSEPLDDTPL